MIKNIVFDFAETIAELNPSKEQTLFEFLRKKEIDISIEKISEVYRYLDLLFPYSSVKIDSTTDKKDFYFKYNEKLFLLLGSSHHSEELHIEFFNFIISQERHWNLKGGVFDLLNNLKNQGYLLSLLSNFDSKLSDILKKMEIYELFDHVYISQDIGYEKPDVKFFEEFLKCSEYNLDETIYIGDNYLLDFIPANKIGLKTYLLDEINLYTNIEDRLNSITEIKKIKGFTNVKI